MTSHKTFKKAAALMLVAVLASRLLGLVRDMLIARQFGQSGPVSAYAAAFNLPDLLYFFLSSGALSSAFIPVFTERFKTGRQHEAWQIFSIIASFMGIVLTAAVVLFEVHAKFLVTWLAMPGNPGLVPLTVHLTRIVLPCQLFFFVGGLIMATLESRQRFSARAAGPVIYNIGIIFGAIVLARWFNIAGLAMGTLIGAFAGNILYAYYCLRKEGYEFRFSLNLRHPGVVRVAALALPVILGLGLPQIDVIINRWFATFVSAAAPAALNNANRLMQVPLGIFAQAAGTAILPMLSAYAAQRATAEMRSGVGYGLRAIMVESIPATAFLIVMADPLVRTIYMSGKFQPSDVGLCVIPLIWYSVGIFAWAGQRIIAPGFFALQDTVTPVVIGTVATVIFIPANYFLMRMMGTGGIALATTIGISLHFFGMTWYLRKRLGGIEGRQLVKTVGKTLVAAAVMGVCCFGVRVGMSSLIGSWQLQDGDVRHPDKFAVMILPARTPLTSYLESKLSQDTRSKTQHYISSEYYAGDLRDPLVKTLNELVMSPDLYNKSRFAHVSPTGQTLRLARDHTNTGRAVLRTNRGLLEAAYPDAFHRVAEVSSLAKWLDPTKPAERGSDGTEWLFTAKDITGLDYLAHQLVDKKNPVSAYIVSQMPSSERAILADYVTNLDAAQGLDTSLLHDLNVAIRTDRIYSPERFRQPTKFGAEYGDVRLSPRLLAMTGATGGKALAEVNRRLLEAAFPDEIVKRPIDRVESKMNSFITVLVAMLVALVVYMPLLKLMRVTEMDYLVDGLRRRLFKRRGRPSEPLTPVEIDAIDPGGPPTSA